MGISYPIISDHIRSYQIISQLRFNIFKLALLLVAFAAVHLAQGEVVWEGTCSGPDTIIDNKMMCDGKVLGSCTPPETPRTRNDNGKTIAECVSSSSQQLPPMKWWPSLFN